MRAIQFSPRAAGTARPVAAEVARPEPGPGQLLVRTELAGVGLGLVRMLRADVPPNPGGELIGTVVAVGAGADGSWLGVRVGGVVFDSLYAEYVCAAPAMVTAIPEGVGAADALAVVRGGLVAMGALRAAGSVAGKSVLITGAASGVGHLALQLARAAGAAQVYAAVGTTAKFDFARGCGADSVLTYHDPWPGDVDVVLDGVGGESVQRAVDVLAPRGILVAFSAGGGAVDTSTLLGRLRTVTGFSIGLVSRTQPEVIESYRSELWKLLADSAIRPQVQVRDWSRLDEVVDLVATRRNTGRMAVAITGG
ncbi:quinone oxidoreductase family protein [Nocardia veterana]|uniref:Zinc-binding alcohol dehydrogenase family protein n=1 Tax=Nocardia veterana TaxID=132249 RepID=A0A7X6LWX3_9NOCA|nr:zinc-binding alcohol dehydrogenase family protein [Nocardia veterana]NKY86145.1 zinc-binding alcohol dehydrogenase family protein [Nocardia veterana]